MPRLSSASFPPSTTLAFAKSRKAEGVERVLEAGRSRRALPFSFCQWLWRLNRTRVGAPGASKLRKGQDGQDGQDCLSASAWEEPSMTADHVDGRYRHSLVCMVKYERCCLIRYATSDQCACAHELTRLSPCTEC